MDVIVNQRMTVPSFRRVKVRDCTWVLGQHRVGKHKTHQYFYSSREPLHASYYDRSSTAADCGLLVVRYCYLRDRIRHIASPTNVPCLSLVA
jgi:hypothetical protein